MTTSRSPREVTAGERAADQAADTALPAPWLRASLPGARPGEWEQLLPKSRQSECYLRGRASSHRPIPATSLNLLDSIPLPDRGMFHASPAAAAALCPATRE